MIFSALSAMKLMFQHIYNPSLAWRMEAFSNNRHNKIQQCMLLTIHNPQTDNQRACVCVCVVCGLLHFPLPYALCCWNSCLKWIFPFVVWYLLPRKASIKRKDNIVLYCTFYGIAAHLFSYRWQISCHGFSLGSPHSIQRHIMTWDFRLCVDFTKSLRKLKSERQGNGGRKRATTKLNSIKAWENASENIMQQINCCTSDFTLEMAESSSSAPILYTHFTASLMTVSRNIKNNLLQMWWTD